MATHEANCPVCGAGIGMTVLAHVGGAVQETIAVFPLETPTAKAAAEYKTARERAEAAAVRANSEAVAAAKSLVAAAKGGD